MTGIFQIKKGNPCALCHEPHIHAYVERQRPEDWCWRYEYLCLECYESFSVSHRIVDDTESHDLAFAQYNGDFKVTMDANGTDYSIQYKNQS